MSIRKIGRIIRLLEKEYGTRPWNWHTQQNEFKVLIGTVLSQRNRDVNTDKAAKALFSRYDTPEKLAKAKLKDIESLIKSSGFYKTKARRIKEISKVIIDKYNGRVPADIEKLTKLMGVGYKTAACVMVYGFGKPEIPVDTHVAKISRRLGLTDEKSPDKIRFDLMKNIPKKHWMVLNELFVKHGQKICHARRPKCNICPISVYCEYYRQRFKS